MPRCLSRLPYGPEFGSLRDVETGNGEIRDIEIPINRALFRKLTASLNDRIRTCIQNVLEHALEGHADAVMLDGQGSKIFTVREIIDELLPGVPIDSLSRECGGNRRRRVHGGLGGPQKEGAVVGGISMVNWHQV